MRILFALLAFVVAAHSAPGGGGSSSWTRYDYVNGKRFVAKGQGTNTTLPSLIYAGDAFSFTITNNSGNLTGKSVSVTTTLTATSGNPQFTYWGEGTFLNPGNRPSDYRLYFSNNPPPYDNEPSCDDCYWFNNQAFVPLFIGIATISGNFDPSVWSNSQGVWATNKLAQFNVAVSNVKQLGLAFGGGSFFDVGVGVKPNTGTATFQLNSFTIQ